MSVSALEVPLADDRSTAPDSSLIPYFSDGHYGVEATLGSKGFASIVEVLRYRAEVQPTDTAFIHLVDGEDIENSISYADLWQRSQAVAFALQPYAPKNKHVLMLFETGIDYVIALFGIFLANATAIPSFPPIGSRALERLAKVASDCEPDLILTNQRFSKLRDRVLAVLPAEHKTPDWIDISCIDLDKHYVELACLPVVEQIALIQYTSGSTSSPKGVLLTHGNLMSNCHSASIWMGGARERVGCSWLPPYHDMGLMGGILQPLYEGFSTVLLAPAHFIQRPSRWLNALSRYQVTVTIAPNFAFDQCVEGVTAEELAALDLSSIKEIYCGSEPVRHSTLERFAQRFAATGFDSRAFGPCYGLAEATVFVTGKPVDSAPILFDVDAQLLSQGYLVSTGRNSTGAVTLVSSGRAAPSHRVVIVDPQTSVPVAEGRIGEIWVQGGNVGAGYWHQPEQSSATFDVNLPDRPGRFMRTGDLGALMRGELYVTGRLKDLIIIAGRNFYPQDLELCVQSADARVRANGVVAFGIDDGTQERLVIVAEIRRNEKLRTEELAEVGRKITEALVSTHGIAPSTLHFCQVGTIPFTTSGKPQRQATKLSLLAGTLAGYAPFNKPAADY